MHTHAYIYVCDDDDGGNGDDDLVKEGVKIYLFKFVLWRRFLSLWE